MSLIKKAISLITGSTPAASNRPLRSMSERQLIELESEIGGKLFGPIPAGHRRDFFCLDATTWVWHEAWVDPVTGKKRMSTTRYEVHEDAVLKAQDGINYRFIEGEELQNFGIAVRMYYEQVVRGIYKRDPYTGQKLTYAPPAAI